MNGDSTQGLLNFSGPVQVPISEIDRLGWKRLSVATGRCTGKCSSCTCVSDLKALSRDAAMEAITFDETGKSLLTPKEIRILRSKREIFIHDNSADDVEIRVSIPPAPLEMCDDDKL